MDYALNPPWWVTNAPGGGRARRRARGPRGADGRLWMVGAPDGTRPPFEPRGPFGPEGPFGPRGPFGPEGPFGPGGGPGHGRRGRARRGDVRLAILALLAEQPLNGYQIIQALAERTEGAWRPSPGAVYPALAQLEDEGLIRADESAGQKAFQLTDAGREAASAIGTKPWDSVRGAAEGWVAEGAPALWREFGQLALAARSVLATGDPELAERARQTFADTRRALYALLAEPGPRS